MRYALLLTILGPLLGLVGCGPACDHSNVCAVTGGTGVDTEVCDGSDFVTCDDGHRGQMIFCGAQPRKAVCAAGGWSFEYAALSSQ